MLVVGGMLGFYLLINRRGLTSIKREISGSDDGKDQDQKDR
jgi:hypothetical protein